MARVSTEHLEELVREAQVLSTIKADVPNAWKILELEIGRARAAVVRSFDENNLSSNPSLSTTTTTPRPSVRRRVRLPVPAEQFPDYNFVGRLLGPRGATLKRLERETGCRIMIRGKGSIRKDKEADVRGKPGWEHVFQEPLHVVIEVADATDDSTVTRILQNAKDIVEILLIPVPEERDSLKRAQLRDLAILNGTHRSVPDLLTTTPPVHPVKLAAAAAAQQNPQSIPTPSASPPPPRRTHSLPISHAIPHPHAHPIPHHAHLLAHHAHSKPAPKPIYTTSAEPYAAMFDSQIPSLTHSYSGQFSASPPPRHISQTQQQNQHNIHSTGLQPKSSPSSTTQDLLPDLEKLRIPTLDFDHLNEANLSTSAFPMPSPSPTIVDPDIYPYPPTPGLIGVDQQYSAFGSPWTPRPAMSALSSTSLPPRSPPAVGENNSTSSSFLLGRPLGDPSRNSQMDHQQDSQQQNSEGQSHANHNSENGHSKNPLQSANPLHVSTSLQSSLHSESQQNSTQIDQQKQNTQNSSTQQDSVSNVHAKDHLKTSNSNSSNPSQNQDSQNQGSSSIPHLSPQYHTSDSTRDGLIFEQSLRGQTTDYHHESASSPPVDINHNHQHFPRLKPSSTDSIVMSNFFPSSNGTYPLSQSLTARRSSQQLSTQDNRQQADPQNDI